MANRMEATEASEYWNQKWKDGDIKWDLGEPAPSLGVLLDSWAIQEFLKLDPMRFNSQADAEVATSPSAETQPSTPANGQHPLANTLKEHRPTRSEPTVDRKTWSEAMKLDKLPKLPKAPSTEDGDGYRHALVPGCGSGYDAVLLAEYGWKVKGVDLSPIAIDRARFIASNYPFEDRIEFEDRDFFTLEPPNSGYQLIFDYTFFCALDPSLREKWAAKMAELLAADGVLVTLMFPTKKFRDHEPPFVSTPEDYAKVLGPHFKQVDMVAEVSPASPRAGYECFAIWQKL